MNQFWIYAMGLSGLLLMACGPTESPADAYGNFEAREWLVSAEANGKLLQFSPQEGQALQAGAVVGYVDSTQFHLKKQQLRSSMQAILSRQQNVDRQLKVYKEQQTNLLREQARVEKLLKDGAATSQQLDEITGQLDVVESQMLAHASSLQTANQSLRREIAPLQDQIAQLDDQIQKSKVRNPESGRVLLTYARAGEITSFGRPLYKLAKLDTMEFRAYFSGDQLAQLKLGQEISVLVDGGNGSFKTLPGTLIWVAEEAEFTPKVIQTRESRVNLVYATKIRVPNDGTLKIGMPGEVRL